MKNNNTKMGTIILKNGDFTLKHFDYCDIYFLFYKDIPVWDGNFEELFVDELRYYIFEIEPDPDKAAEFIHEIYNWCDTQQEALEKLLDEIYIEK